MPVVHAVSGLAACLAVSCALFLLGSPAAAEAIPDFGTDPVQDISSPQGSSITDVRVGANEGFDRFVVEFEDDVGAYFVSYVTQVSEDGSGDPVPVEGTAFVQVTLAGVPNDPQAPQDTIDADLTGLVQVVGAGAGFEATVSYGLGTAAASGFRAFVLTEPSRLVVDIAHPDVVPTATNTADPTAESTAATSEAAGSPEATPSEAARESDSSNSWMIFLIVGLVVFAIVTGILGWRMRRPS
ncbi:MAG: AMIN-like domain-containing (lipo)protein [Geodermatophilaceae bacterium]